MIQKKASEVSEAFILRCIFFLGHDLNIILFIIFCDAVITLLWANISDKNFRSKPIVIIMVNLIVWFYR